MIHQKDNFNNKTEFKKVVGYDSLNFKNWICSSGENAFFVDPFGDIYPCGGLYTKRKIIYNHTKMKNIFTKNIENDKIIETTKTDNQGPKFFI